MSPPGVVNLIGKVSIWKVESSLKGRAGSSPADTAMFASRMSKGGF